MNTTPSLTEDEAIFLEKEGRALALSRAMPRNDEEEWACARVRAKKATLSDALDYAISFTAFCLSEYDDHDLGWWNDVVLASLSRSMRRYASRELRRELRKPGLGPALWQEIACTERWPDRRPTRRHR